MERHETCANLNILVVNLKGKREMGNVDFNNALYLTQHVQSILTCNQYKLDIYTHCFRLSLQNPVCTFAAYLSSDWVS